MALARKSSLSHSARKAFVADARPALTARTKLQICKAVSDSTTVRRDVLLSGAAAAAASLLQASPAMAAMKEMPVSSLSTFQKGAQRAAFQSAAEAALKGKFAAADAPQLLALILHDAATYDAVSQTGGFDGSIVLSSEELARPENAYLKPMAEKVKAARAAVDAATPEGCGPISVADTLVLACKVSTQAAWKEVKLKKTVTTSGGDIIATVYGTDWPVRLGRSDDPNAAPAGRLPAESAPVAEIVAFMKELGVKPGSGAGPFTPKPPFWERPTFILWPAATSDPAGTEARFVSEDPESFKGSKTDYDRSRGTLTRTEYEVDFINNFTKLTALGAKFKSDAYLHPETTLQLKF